MTGNAQHSAAAAIALAALAIAAAPHADPGDRGGADTRRGAASLPGGRQIGPIGLLLLLDAGDTVAEPGLDRFRFGAALGWSAGIASAGVAALAIGDTLSGRREDQRRSVLRSLYAHFRLSPSILSTPDGNAGVGATFTVLF